MRIFPREFSATRQPIATRGGGIDNTGSLTLVTATLSDNNVTGTDGDAGESPLPGGSPGGDALGGGLYNSSSARIVNTTIANNRVVGGNGGEDMSGVEAGGPGAGGNGNGGAIANDGGTLFLTHCTLAGNTAASGGPDVRGTFVSGPTGVGGANLIGNVGLAAGFVTGVDIIGGDGQPVVNPRLGALANNGGATQTIALLAASPAFGAGRNALAVDANNAALGTDQRGSGFTRIVGAAVDIGAFEEQRTTASIADN